VNLENSGEKKVLKILKREQTLGKGERVCYIRNIFGEKA
jgi:hypothetical protein